MPLISDELRFKIFQEMSGNFLINQIPDNWEDLEEDDQHEYLMDNIWEPMEGYFPSKVAEIIKNATDNMLVFLGGCTVQLSVPKEDAGD